MRTTTNFEEFMSYIDWDELDINEKRALLDAASSLIEIDLGLFRTQFVNSLEDKTILECPLGEIGLILDLNTRRDFIRYIEHFCMGDEPFESYFSMQEQMENEDFRQAVTTNIVMLPQENWKVVKWIQVVVKGQTRPHIATIAYKRDLSQLYKMNPNPEKEEMRAFLGYQESEYPDDALDKTIYAAINQAYPEVNKMTKLQLFNTDLAAQGRFKQSHFRTNGAIIIAASNGECVRIPINIYCNTHSDMDIFSNSTMAVMIFDDEWKELQPIFNTIKTL